MDNEEKKDVSELEQVKTALGTLEDRVTRIEFLRKYNDREDGIFQKAARFVAANAEILAGLALFIGLNLILWERISHAN